MAQKSTQRTPKTAPIPPVVVGGPADSSIPRPTGPSTAFFNEFRTAMHSYPDEDVVLEIVEVDFPGGVINTAEEGSFRVRVTNNGLLDMTDVTLKVRGLNGAQVKTGGAADFDFRDELTIGMDSETVVGQGGSSLTQGSKLEFKAPANTKPAGTPLFKATLDNWNGSLVRILNGHSHGDDDAPAGTYSDEVVGQ